MIHNSKESLEATFKNEPPVDFAVDANRKKMSQALDSVRNEYLLHREIHNWYVNGEVSDDFDTLNERVYSDLFLTPSSDPWLGLAPRDVYTALDEGGFVVTEAP